MELSRKSALFLGPSSLAPNYEPRPAGCYYEMTEEKG
jgi:hypothetical protein